MLDLFIYFATHLLPHCSEISPATTSSRPRFRSSASIPRRRPSSPSPPIQISSSPPHRHLINSPRRHKLLVTLPQSLGSRSGRLIDRRLPPPSRFPPSHPGDHLRRCSISPPGVDGNPDRGSPHPIELLCVATFAKRDHHSPLIHNLAVGNLEAPPPLPSALINRSSVVFDSSIQPFLLQCATPIKIASDVSTLSSPRYNVTSSPRRRSASQLKPSSSHHRRRQSRSVSTYFISSATPSSDL